MLALRVGMREEREEPTAPKRKVGGQLPGAYASDDDPVCVESFSVHSRGEDGIGALVQPAG